MSENNGSSNNEFKPAPWEKEANSMDDKKNVSFVSGLALLLSVLALVLIGWGNIADSPSQAQYKELLDRELDVVNQNVLEIDSRIAKQMTFHKTKMRKKSILKLAELNAKINTLKSCAPQGFDKDYQALQAMIQAMMVKMNREKAADPAKEKPEKAVKSEKGTKAEKAHKPCKDHSKEKAKH